MIHLTECLYNCLYNRVFIPKFHWSTAAVASYTKSREASLPKIIQNASWTIKRAFTQFYDKKIEEEAEFQIYMLQDN